MPETPPTLDGSPDLLVKLAEFMADVTAIEEIVPPGRDVPVGAQRLVPPSWTVERVDYAPHAPAPRRKAGEFTHFDPASFGRYVGKHATDATEVWVDLDAAAQAVAVIDGHAGDEPAWAEHRAVLHLRPDPLFSRLAAMHARSEQGRSFLQGEFAREIERLARVIAQPSHAELRALIDTLRATANSEVVDSGVTGNDGRTVTYKIDTKVKAGRNGEATFPERIVCQVAPWFGVPAVELEVQVFVTVEASEGARPQIDVLIPRLDDVRRDGVNVAIAIAEAASEGVDPNVAALKAMTGADLTRFGQSPLYYASGHRYHTTWT